MIRVIICGVNGKMGQVLLKAINETDGIIVVAGVDKYINDSTNGFPIYKSINDVSVDADVIIDFSRPEALEANLIYAQENDLCIIIATTGLSNSDVARIKEASTKIPVFFSAKTCHWVSIFKLSYQKKRLHFLAKRTI